MKKTGASLLEMLVTMGLMLVAIVVAGGLFTNYSRVSAFSAVRDQARRSSEDALAAMREDIEAAHSLTPGTNSLDLVRIDHSLPHRFDPSAGDWVVRSLTQFRSRVEYRLVGDTLVRSSLPPAPNPRVDSILAYDVHGFRVSLSTDPEVLELYTVELTLAGDRHGLLRTSQTSIARMTYLP